jgi:hypothetical protein
VAAHIRACWDYVRGQHGRRGPAPGGEAQAPPWPHELTYALRVSVDGLRPWEYDGMSAWDYDRIVHAQLIWNDAKRKNPPLPPADEAHTPPPIVPGVGPQMPERKR